MPNQGLLQNIQYNETMTELHTDIDNIPAEAQNCILMIGNFDGIHLGHRALIEKAHDLAAETQTPLGIITFEPHPLQFFQPETEPFRLTLLPMKKRLLEELGVEMPPESADRGTTLVDRTLNRRAVWPSRADWLRGPARGTERTSGVQARLRGRAET